MIQLSADHDRIERVLPRQCIRLEVVAQHTLQGAERAGRGHEPHNDVPTTLVRSNIIAKPLRLTLSG